MLSQVIGCELKRPSNVRKNGQTAGLGVHFPSLNKGKGAGKEV
jgi:hypothetical protein